MIDEYVSDMRNAVFGRSPYSALAMALALPDICGKIENPALGSRARYMEWYATNCFPHVSGFISPTDCYLLRCAYLHSADGRLGGGKDKMADKMESVRERVHFFDGGGVIGGWQALGGEPGRPKHVVEISVQEFCSRIGNCAIKWLVADPGAEQRRQAVDALLRFRRIDES